MHSIPFAYLLTFRAYGTWLHGDERGSVDRLSNAWGTPGLMPSASMHAYCTQLLRGQPVYLDEGRRTIAYNALAETAAFCGWTVHAVNVRTNHVHCVLSIGDADPNRAVAAIKANATRCMRAAGCWTEKHSPWAEGGSTRYLWKEKDLPDAVAYVLHGQGDELPGHQNPER